MSDLGRRAYLTPSQAQLSVSAYFDETAYRQEISSLFKKGPGYLGHELMVPNVGDYHVLDAENGGRMLARGEAGIECLSNVCRHRQASCCRAEAMPTALFVRCIDGPTIYREHCWARPISSSSLV